MSVYLKNLVRGMQCATMQRHAGSAGLLLEDHAWDTGDRYVPLPDPRHPGVYRRCYFKHQEKSIWNDTDDESEWMVV